MRQTTAAKATIGFAVILMLAVSATAQKHTAFNGVWPGMTTAEFLATEKGAATAAPYKDGCSKDEAGFKKNAAACGDWEHLISDSGFSVDLHSQSGKSDTWYSFNNRKLVQVHYQPDGSGAQFFNQQVNFLTQKYGKPTYSSVVVRQNEFGARLSFKTVQWKRPDGVVISAEAGTFLDALTNVTFTLEEPKAQAATKNLY
jgi:hypothetical protein